MSRNELLRRIKGAKTPLLILCVGLLLLLLTGRNDGRAAEEPSAAPAAEETAAEAEKRLSSLLEVIDGVGKNRVLLSLSVSSETEYITDEGETVILSSGGGKQTALPRRTRYPQYQGAVVVCQGGDDAGVRLLVTEAVAQFTGLRSDRITVLKLAD